MGSIFPYFIPLIIFILYIFENELSGTSLKENAFRELQFFFAFSTSGIYSATYCYRYNKFHLFVKNLEVLMLICAFALILALPKLAVSTDGITQIGGGNHQAISYTSALAFGVLFCSLMTKSPQNRYQIFNYKLYKILTLPILILLCVICLIGGGRGGVVLLFTNFLLCTYLLARKHFIKVIFVILLSLLAIYFLISFVSSGLTEIFEKGFERSFAFIGASGNIDLANGSSGRDIVYLKAINLILESPIFGYGIFQQYDLCQKYLLQPYSHNIFIEILLQGGLIFLTITIITLSVFLKKLYLLITKKGINIFLIPITTFPIIQLLFSNTYLCSPLFWFSLIFVFNCMVKSNRSATNHIIINNV